MADSLQESLKIASRKFEQWKKRMQEAGYTVVGENAFKREKDATSPSGYRDVPVTNYNKDIRNNSYGNLPASAGPDITVPRTGNYESIQPRTWTEKLTIPKTNYVQTASPTWNVKTNEEGGLPIEETVTIDKKNTAAKSPKVDAGRDKWLEETRNSPAARAGISPEMRWQAQERHREFKKERRSSKESRIKRRNERLKKKKNALKINSRY